MLKDFSFEEVDKVAKDIEGWLGEGESRLLYDTAEKLTGNGAIVEIGSWCGKSLTYITAGSIKGGDKNKIYTIDPYLTSKDEPNGKYETFISNLKDNGIFDKITHIKEKSQVAGEKFNEAIEFIFIDGFHKYDAVKKDFELFFPKVVEGGYIAFHDVIYFKGPTDLMKEIAQRNDLKILELCESIILAQKVAELSDEEIENNKKIIETIEEKIRRDNIVPAE